MLIETMLEIKSVRVRHVGPINWSIQKRQCAGLTGSSGSGKSLLLRAVANLIPHEGYSLLNNQSNLTIPAPIWRKKVMLVPAEPRWWFDNVAEHFSHMDEGLRSSLGLPADIWQAMVNDLSSGERKRLALLRALEHRPAALLLDEPTANLDDKTARAVEQVVLEYANTHDACVLWVSHDRKQLTRVASDRSNCRLLNSKGLAEHITTWT